MVAGGAAVTACPLGADAVWGRLNTPPVSQCTMQEIDVNEPDPLPDRYAAVKGEASHLVVYDRENGDAWIESDVYLGTKHMV